MQNELSNVEKIANGEGVTFDNQVFAWDPETFKYKQTFRKYKNKPDEEISEDTRYTQRELISRASSYYKVPKSFTGFGKAEEVSTGIQTATETKLAEEQKVAQKEEANRMKVIEGLFGDDANEDDAVAALRIEYPDLKVGVASLNIRQKITVDGEAFYLKGKGNSTAEMEMRRLQKKLGIGGTDETTQDYVGGKKFEYVGGSKPWKPVE